MSADLLGPVLLGASTLGLAALVYADLSALLAHVTIGVGAYLAFPTWTGRLVAFVAANVSGIAVGLVARSLRR